MLGVLLRTSGPGASKTAAICAVQQLIHTKSNALHSITGQQCTCCIPFNTSPNSNARTLPSTPLNTNITSRTFSSEAATTEPPVGNEKVQKLAEEIAGLSVLECSWLTQILRKKLGIERSAMSMMPMMSAAPAAAPAAAAADEAPKEEKKEEKKEFDLKLESFGADAKIKIIKEVRALTNLGLKEAKELVEKAPVVIKGGLAKADAEAMMKQLAAVGAKVVLE